MGLLWRMAVAFAAEINNAKLERERAIIEARVRADLESTHHLRLTDRSPRTAPPAQKLN